MSPLQFRTVPQIMDGVVTDLGARIKRARQLLGLTQAQLGTRVGATARAVGSWERGEKVPRNLPLLEVALAPYFSADGDAEPPDPREQEIRDMDWLTPAEQESWIELYRKRKASPPGAERAAS